MEQSQLKFTITTPIAIIIAGSIIAGGLYLGLSGRGAPDRADPGQQAPAPAADVGKVSLDDEPFIGKRDAPAAMAYWYDYQCPFCQRHEEQALPQIIKDYVDTGKLRLVFKDYQFLGPDSQTLGKFSRAVWETAPEKFYAWHKAVYDNQGQENTGWATQNKILAITTSALGADLAARVANLVKMKGDTYQQAMDADRSEGTAMNITGTPGTIVGKRLISGAQPYEVFKAAIDIALAAK